MDEITHIDPYAEGKTELKTNSDPRLTFVLKKLSMLTHEAPRATLHTHANLTKA